MKRVYMAIGLLTVTLQSYAQTGLRYNDEGFNTIKAEQKYAASTPGQQFATRMNTLYQVSNKSAIVRITRTEYDQFLKDFQHKANAYNGNAITKQKLQNLSAALQQVNDLVYNNDGYRNTMYTNAMYVYKATDESWGEEVLSVAISNAYFNIHEYSALNAADDINVKAALQVLNTVEPLIISKGETCNYTVAIDKKLSKDNIAVYFSDPALYDKASKKYGAERLLSGPIAGWDSNVDESATVKNMLKAYATAQDKAGYYIYESEMKPAERTVQLQQALYKDTKWYVWVFRNDKLYYSYMAEPCSPSNRIYVR